MRTFKVEVKDKQGWDGYIVMKHVSYEDKWDFVEEFGDVSSLVGRDQIKAIRALIKKCEPYFLEVNLKNEALALSCNSIDDIKLSPELHDLLTTCSLRCVNGNVGNV